MAKKQKTHSGAAKRFKKRGDGYKAKQKGLRHILTKRTTKSKRQCRAKFQISDSDIARVDKMLRK